MKTFYIAALMVVMVGLLTYGYAQEAAEAAEAAAQAPALGVEALQQSLGQGLQAGISGEGLEAWFFSFLEKLLNLLAAFIGQIINQVFGGVGMMFSQGMPPHSAV